MSVTCQNPILPPTFPYWSDNAMIILLASLSLAGWSSVTVFYADTGGAVLPYGGNF